MYEHLKEKERVFVILI